MAFKTNLFPRVNKSINLELIDQLHAPPNISLRKCLFIYT